MSEDTNADEKKVVDVADPYGHLIPVLAGVEPERAEYVVSDRMAVSPVEKGDRNLWHLDIDDSEVVTFDADAFATTTDLGLYIDGVLEGFRGGFEEMEDDPRRLDEPDGRSYQ